MASDTKTIAVVGATGAVGRRMVDELVPFVRDGFGLRLFASERSKDALVECSGKQLRVEVYAPEKLEGIPYVLMSAGGSFSKIESPKLVSQGSFVIDNSSAWRMDPNTLLCVPEINANFLSGLKPSIIANPNCSTIQLVVSLASLKRDFGILKVIVSSYQSVSGTGQKGIEELAMQTTQISDHPSGLWINNVPSVYSKPIAGNVIPAIDKLDLEGHCFEEEKIVRESRKIFMELNLDIMATTARVPSFFCHAESVSVQLARKVSLKELRACFAADQNIRYSDGTAYEQLPTSVDSFDSPKVFVSRARLRLDQTHDDWIQYWNISDNLRKGAATNAVEILRKLIAR